MSHSERKILQYYLMFQSNKNILIIDEPFIDLDYQEKKKIISIINKLVHDGKTIIIGSDDINIIYSLCKKVLLIKETNIDYQNIKCLTKIEQNLQNINIFLN